MKEERKGSSDGMAQQAWVSLGFGGLVIILIGGLTTSGSGGGYWAAFTLGLSLFLLSIVGVVVSGRERQP